MNKENTNNVIDAGEVFDEAKDSGTAVFADTATPDDPSVSGSADGHPTLEVCRTNREAGFHPLNKFLRHKFLKLTISFLKKLCGKAFRIDFDYWEKIAEKIISTESADDVLIVGAPAGYGKSTLIRAMLLAFLTLCRENPSYRAELGGIVLVLQKVEDLNALVKLVQMHMPDCQDIVALQSWSRSGQSEGFCKNPEIHSYQECAPKSCPYAADCRLLLFKEMAACTPVVCLTQARFKLLLEAQILDTILNYTLPDGRIVPRRYVFFDENPRLAHIAHLDQAQINAASTDLGSLLSRRATDDRGPRWGQGTLSYTVAAPYQFLRNTAGMEGTSRSDATAVEPVAGWVRYSLPPDSKQRASYDALNLYLHKSHAPISPALQNMREVMNPLYANKRCLFVRSRGFHLFTIRSPQYLFYNQLSVIFDATAAVDGDYDGIEDKEMLPLPPARDLSNVTFHVYTASIMGVSKYALNAPWKVTSFARKIGDILADNPAPTFLVTHQSCSKAIYDALEAELDKDLLGLLALMPGRREQLPYFGGTNGSNAFNHCTQVILLGYPRLNPETVLTSACAAYGAESIVADLDEYQQLNGTVTDPFDLLQLPRVGNYSLRYTVARMEQDIYRTALRNYRNCAPINVHMFCPQEQELELLLDRFPGAKVIEHSNAPAYFANRKALDRTYKGVKTHYAQLEELLRSGLNFPIEATSVRDLLGLNKNAWDDLMKQERTRELLLRYHIKRSRAGRSSVWYCDVDNRESA